MNSFTVVFLFAMAAAAFASPFAGGVHPDIAANANRQRHVNRVAEYIGSGTGTARYYGVPGVDDYGYGGYAYNGGYGGYGPYSGGYGYNAQGGAYGGALYGQGYGYPAGH